MRHLVVAIAVLASGLSATPRGPQTAAPRSPDVRVPEPTPSRFASYNYGIGVRIPRGLYYCRIPPDWVGSDHGRVFYLEPPKACDSTAGNVLGPVAEDVPRIDLFYGYNVEQEFRDGLRNPRTADELVRPDCAKARPLAGIKLLGRPAIGCETERDGWVDLSASTPYRLEAIDRTADPDALVSVRLLTTRGRYVSDRTVFFTIISSIQVCAAKWQDERSGKSFWVGAAPGRPVCPANAFW